MDKDMIQNQFNLHELMNHTEQLHNEQDKAQVGIFSIKTANQCVADAKKRPIAYSCDSGHLILV